jgi:fermentation-respiration switch protein FrsA (DUF1100 family)
VLETVLTILLHHHPLQMHLANANNADGRPLLVYATGDGGWHRKDLSTYHELVTLGLPTAGFDARDYVTHLEGGTTTPQALADDYGQIIAEARKALRLRADYPVVLVGVSRGAGLEVVAAGEGTLGPSLIGVVAVALTREEEYVNASPPPYDALPRLPSTPIAVVQSTRDKYLPAADARALFGPDTPYRWLQPIEARNHSFGGARPQLYEAIRRALAWILTLRPLTGSPGRPGRPG